MTMNRKDYLEMCREVSQLPGGIEGIKTDIPERLLVLYDGIPYYPIAYKLSFGADGSALHTAVLHDLQARAITEAELKKVYAKAEGVEEEK